ncbi:LCP family protein [Catenisphaera adipataccumulans]|uniref:LCP family glycopolymer transferase n=1 Tax=Catenisphaera adipataccumulans TaxID=700500 RepID=UPI003D90C183
MTHTGLYGVDTTEQTIEDLLGIEINYYARVNFSSLVNLVDALGGINIYVEKGMAVDTFYANSTLKGGP